MSRYGLIAGSGQFPFLVLDAARSRGIEMVVAAIREEASPELESRASCLHWLGLGELSRLIKIFKQEGVNRAVMAGQIRHNQIFSSIRPDWKLLQVLLSLREKNTDALIGAVARVLSQEGIELENSTVFLQPLLAAEGVLTRRGPSDDELRNIAYGLKIARVLGQMDLGQTVVVAEQACVALEAMEGTDAVIRRAAELAKGQPLTVVKVAKAAQDMRFDVPVIGIPTVTTMRECGATALSIDAAKTLVFDRDQLLAAANEAGIAIVGTAAGAQVVELTRKTEEV
jgi:UDP-2,3-diacylglucosamine hydrolase